jgi:hypothetical protein
MDCARGTWLEIGLGKVDGGEEDHCVHIFVVVFVLRVRDVRGAEAEDEDVEEHGDGARSGMKGLCTTK